MNNLERDAYLGKLEGTKNDLEMAYKAAREMVTPARMYRAVDQLARVYAPSGSVIYTLGPMIESILEEYDGGDSHLFFDNSYKNTKNPAVLIYQRRNIGNIPPHFILNHGDEVSYEVSDGGNSEATITPLCAHRQNPNTYGFSEIQFPGVALRYREAKSGVQSLELVAEGKIVTSQKGSIHFITEHGPDDQLQIGDRVVFNPHPRLILDPNNRDTIYGIVDNRAGVAIGLMVGVALANLQKINPDQFSDVATFIVITDREEGIPDPPSFARGAKDLALAMKGDNRLSNSQMIVNDGHDFTRGSKIAEGALIARVVSHGKGPTIDSDRMFRIRKIIDLAKSYGAHAYVDEDIGIQTSRSDDQGLREGGIPDNRIWPIGHGTIEPHHGDGYPAEASLKNLVDTAHFLTLVSVAASKNLLY